MDYYAVLGLSKGASSDEVKKAFKKKAMKYHPDRTGNDKTAEKKFKEVKEAYDVLSDPQKKSSMISMVRQILEVDLAVALKVASTLLDLKIFSKIFLEIYLVEAALEIQIVHTKVVT